MTISLKTLTSPSLSGTSREAKNNFAAVLMMYLVTNLVQLPKNLRTSFLHPHIKTMLYNGSVWEVMVL